MTSSQILPYSFDSQGVSVHEYHSEMSVTDWFRITMDHMVGSDWSTGGMHVTGTSNRLFGRGPMRRSFSRVCAYDLGIIRLD